MSGLRTTSMGSIGGGIAIKFELQRAKDIELRRLRGEYTFDELLSAVNQMWGGNAPKRLTVEYVDDEGDRIKIGSEAEWAETVAMHIAGGSSALRLFVRRGRKSAGRKESEDAESESEPDAAEAALAPRATPVPPLKLPQPDPTPAAVALPARADPALPPAGTTPTSEVHVETGDEGQAAVVDLLSRLYDCDAGREMMNMFSAVDFAPIVRRRLDALAGEVLVDIDNVALRHLTISRTNMWIGQRLYEKAEATLQAALLVWPADQVLEYNAACAAALRGDAVKALAMLEASVTHGYSDVSQLENDPDLATVRKTARFKGIVALVQRREPDVTIVEPATVEPANPPEVSAPAVPVPVPVTVGKPTPAEKYDPVATLIAMFPQLSADAAARVLKRHNGDLSRAAGSLLC